MAINIYIIHNSPFFIKSVSHYFKDSDSINVTGIASKWLDAKETLRREDSSVILMAPKFDRITCAKMTRELMTNGCEHPIIVVGDGSEKTRESSFSAFQEGAMNFFQLPEVPTTINIEKSLPELEAMIHLVSRVKVIRHVDSKKEYNRVNKCIGKAGTRKIISRADSLVVIGVSTGGVSAIRAILNGFSESFTAAVVLAQHMPAQFMDDYAELLDKQTSLAVRKIENRDQLLSRTVYISSQRKNIAVNYDYTVEYVKPENNSGVFIPSIDMLFKSASRLKGKKVGVILTGMGRDGTIGAGALKACGAKIIVQTSDSCVVSGMPDSVIEAGYADFQLEPALIAAKIEELLK